MVGQLENCSIHGVGKVVWYIRPMSMIILCKGVIFKAFLIQTSSPLFVDNMTDRKSGRGCTFVDRDG